MDSPICCGKFQQELDTSLHWSELRTQLYPAERATAGPRDEGSGGHIATGQQAKRGRDVLRGFILCDLDLKLT